MMAERSNPGRSGWRRAREAAFAACTAWLVVQNGMLLAYGLTRWPEPGWATLVTLGRDVLGVLAPMWAIACAAVLGWAFTMWLARGAQPDAGVGEWERGHGRAR